MVRRRICATPEEQFDAWIDSGGMRHWMCPGDVVSTQVKLEPHVGGASLIVMRRPTATYEQTGEFRIVDRPSKLAFTWTADAMNGQLTLVTIRGREIARAALFEKHYGILAGCVVRSRAAINKLPKMSRSDLWGRRCRLGLPWEPP